MMLTDAYARSAGVLRVSVSQVLRFSGAAGGEDVVLCCVATGLCVVTGLFLSLLFLRQAGLDRFGFVLRSFNWCSPHLDMGKRRILVPAIVGRRACTCGLLMRHVRPRGSHCRLVYSSTQTENPNCCNTAVKTEAAAAVVIDACHRGYYCCLVPLQPTCDTGFR